MKRHTAKEHKILGHREVYGLFNSKNNSWYCDDNQCFVTNPTSRRFYENIESWKNDRIFVLYNISPFISVKRFWLVKKPPIKTILVKHSLMRFDLVLLDNVHLCIIININGNVYPTYDLIELNDFNIIKDVVSSRLHFLISCKNMKEAITHVQTKYSFEFEPLILNKT